MTTTVEPGKTRIGWIGTGVMGASMCGHVLDKGFAVTLHSRTRDKAEPLLARGAAWADSPRAVADASDVVFTMRRLPRRGARASISATAALATQRARGTDPGRHVDERAGAGARDRRRGARARRLRRRRAGLGRRRRRARGAAVDHGRRRRRRRRGAAAAVRGDGQDHRASGRRRRRPAHQDGQPDPDRQRHDRRLRGAPLRARAPASIPTRVLQSVASGAAGAWSLSNYGPRILAGNFEPGFFVEHFIKDMGIALDEARRMQLSLPGLALAAQLYQSVQALGYGRKGTHALQLALAAMSGARVAEKGRMTHFRPPRWLRGRHAQTVWASVFRMPIRLPLPSRALGAARRRLPRRRRHAARPTPMRRSSSSVTGSRAARSAGYVRGLLRELGARRPRRASRINFRGCSGEPNRLPRFYHSGDTGDLAFVVDKLCAERPGRALGLAGFSLGGNVVAKYLGERGDGVPAEVRAGAVRLGALRSGAAAPRASTGRA